MLAGVTSLGRGRDGLGRKIDTKSEESRGLLAARLQQAVWDGTERPGRDGIPLFNVDDASQAFFLFEVGPDLFTVREYASKDRWASGGWTPAAWRFPVRRLA